MSELPPETAPVDEPVPSSPPPLPSAGTLQPPWRLAALVLGAAFVLVAALVASAPLWAPALPWGTTDRGQEHEVAAHLDRLAAAQADVQRQLKQASADTDKSLQRLAQRLDTIEARPAASPADIAGMRKQLADVSTVTAVLTSRPDAIDKAVHAETAHAAAATDAALPLALLQVRDAVAAGRPFAAEYETLAGLAHSRPEIAAVAAPLAEPAKTGVATYAVLAKGLHDLGITLADARATPKQPQNWRQQMLAQLRGLVTIRRIDAGGGSASGPQHAANTAAAALAIGDLPGAVAAVETLSGAQAERASPWLRMAHQRLAVDAALQRVEALLTAGLDNPPAAAPAGRPPG